MPTTKVIDLPGLFPLQKAQIRIAADMLARAFMHDPKIIHILPNDDKRTTTLRNLLEFEIKYGIIYGQVYTTSPNMEGIAFWLPSKYAEITLLRAILADGYKMPLQIGLKAFYKSLSLSGYIDTIRRKHLSGPYWYLFFIGVDPSCQGQGYASRLISPMLEYVDHEGYPIYLLTENKQNIPIYEHFGFKIIDHFVVPGTNVENWAMLRKPLVVSN